MQALSSSALNAPVEGQAAAADERANKEFVELRRAALERVEAFKRHNTGVLPGTVSFCGERADPPRQPQRTKHICIAVPDWSRVGFCR